MQNALDECHWFPHPVRGGPPVAIDGGVLPAFPTQRQMASDSPRLQRGEIRFVAVAGVRKHLRRHSPARCRGRVHHGQHLPLIRRPPGQPPWQRSSGSSRPPQPARWCIAGTLAAGLHDAALGVREVALRFRFRLPESALNGCPPPPLGLRSSPGIRPRSRSRARCSASSRAFAASIAASRASRRFSFSGSSSPRTASPRRASSSASTSSACAYSAWISARSRASSRFIRS